MARVESRTEEKLFETDYLLGVYDGHRMGALRFKLEEDGQDHTDGTSYLELVEFITTHGANVDQDLEELWRRIVFSICTSNTDDHLRNHGFILSEGGWLLSPAYDINPIETGNGLKLYISETDNALDLNLALDASEFFRLREDRAREIILGVKSSVRNWKRVAIRYKIPRSAQELKAMAFQHAVI